MTFYPSAVTKFFNCPKNAGKLAEKNAVGTNADLVCGSVLRFSLKINKQKIIDVKFQTNGCGYLISAAQVLAEHLINKQLNELNGLSEDNLKHQLENVLGKFPADRNHCLSLCLQTLHDAFTDFRSRRLEEFGSEEALICTCFGVSEKTVEKVIAEFQLENVEEVGEICNAGRGCGSCHFLIREMLDFR